MYTRALESSRRPPLPPEAFSFPDDGPFAFLFVRSKQAAVWGEDPPKDPPKEPPRPTATDAHTTGHDGADPNPLHNEEMDWENDD